MARLQAKALSEPDEVRRVPNGTVEIYNLDDVVVGRLVFHPGWRWSTDVGPIAGTSSCQYHHLGGQRQRALHRPDGRWDDVRDRLAVGLRDPARS